MEIPKVKLDFSDSNYKAAVKAHKINKTFVTSAELRPWLRPYLVDELGLISSRDYDQKGYSRFNAGVFSLQLDSLSPKPKSFRFNMRFFEQKGAPLENIAVLCDAALLSARDDGQLKKENGDTNYDFDGTDLNSHLDSLGECIHYVESRFSAAHLGAVVAALDFTDKVYKNMGNADFVRFVRFRTGLLHMMRSGVLPKKDDNTSQYMREGFEEQKELLTKQLKQYETALRQYF